LFSLTSGDSNTAVGLHALYFTTTGDQNTAVGVRALENNTIGFGNTAIGDVALFANTVGSDNTALGTGALESNVSGGDNTAAGRFALFNNTTGLFNVAVGSLTMLDNTKGSQNTALGNNALLINTTGDENTAIGNSALHDTSGKGNIGLGVEAGSKLTDGDNNIAIGNPGVAGESGTVRIGTPDVHTSAYIAGVAMTPLTTGSAVAVGITPDGQLGVRASSSRYKEKVKPMAKSSEVILSLKPVTFRYKKELDPEAIPQFGLVAEDVARVNPDLVARDEEGKPYTVRYEAVNAMLLNEFLKEHRKVEQEAEINQRQEATIARLEAALKEQATQIQKVSDRIGAQAPRVVADN
jgi:hypothetical protein